jgi:KaiC/GvpD/RAD55 family RecA-like ATPase
MLELKEATRDQSKLRMILLGIPGSGKTYTALNIAINLVPGGKVLLLDSEYGSASKYSEGKPFRFFTHKITDPNPLNYVKLIKEAQTQVDVLILDSISHAWQALLDLVTEESKKSNRAFAGWDKATPIQRQFVEAILAADCHIIATSRVKTEYSTERDEKTGKVKIAKLGTKPEQRENIEYEFDIVGEMDERNMLTITKTRCPELNRKIFHEPGKDVADILIAWLGEGVTSNQVVRGSNGPKPQIADESDSPADSTEQAERTVAETPTKSELVSSEQMQQLLQVGEKENGWPRAEINALLKKHGAASGKITWKTWETVLKLVSVAYKEAASA